jgi:penicillin-binding protein 2
MRGRKKISSRLKTRQISEIAPDEIFLDANNLPGLNVSQFEGRIVQPISKRSLAVVGSFFLLIVLIFSGRLFLLQIVRGGEYSVISEDNRLAHSVVFAGRGVIYDRTGEELAWNAPKENEVFSRRMYTKRSGLAHVLGYITLPKKDSSGAYYEESTVGLFGAEKEYDDILKGNNGLKIVETDAFSVVQSESVISEPIDGKPLTLSVDARMTEALHRAIGNLSEEAGFVGGAGVIMDVNTGEIVALTSYPEYDSEILSSGEGSSVIGEYIRNDRKPFLNRVVSGLYAPGSIVKPFVAFGALAENIISPEKEIYSSGALSIPNPYNPDKPTIIRDWRAHGWTDMRRAIAVSSDVYFYTIGGGYENQTGLKIAGIEKYSRLFGLGEPTGLSIAPEEAGTIPNPAWKKKVFDDDWRLGDTYNTAIGQYGFQVTPLQMVRAVSAIANDGMLLTPTILASSTRIVRPLDFDEGYFTIIKEGMRQAVTDGTAQGLSQPSVKFAAKTGTAEVGEKKEFINSWAVGFFPYETPRYAFAILMDRGKSGTLTGGVLAGRRFLESALVTSPEYFDVVQR